MFALPIGTAVRAKVYRPCLPNADRIRAKMERGYYGPSGSRRWLKARRRYDRAVSVGGWVETPFLFGTLQVADIDNASAFFVSLEEP